MEFSEYFRFLAALALVLALIALLAALAKRFGMVPRITDARGRKGRIGIVEVRPVDARRRLVLIRRDDVEYLLLISPQHETVIEGPIPAMDDGLSPSATAPPPEQTGKEQES